MAEMESIESFSAVLKLPFIFCVGEFEDVGFGRVKFESSIWFFLEIDQVVQEGYVGLCFLL